MITNSTVKKFYEALKDYNGKISNFRYSVDGKIKFTADPIPIESNYPTDMYSFVKWIKSGMPTFKIAEKLVGLFDSENTLGDFKVRELELPYPVFAVDASDLKIPDTDIVFIAQLISQPKYFSFFYFLNDTEGKGFSLQMHESKVNLTCEEAMNNLFDNITDEESKTNKRIVNYMLNAILYIMNYNDDRVGDSTYKNEHLRQSRRSKNNPPKNRTCGLIPIGIPLTAFTIGGNAVIQFPSDAKTIDVRAHYRHFRSDFYVNMKGKSKLIISYPRRIHGEPTKQIEIIVK
jgi:hypothetical protein